MHLVVIVVFTKFITFIWLQSRDLKPGLETQPPKWMQTRIQERRNLRQQRQRMLFQLCPDTLMLPVKGCSMVFPGVKAMVNEW